MQKETKRVKCACDSCDCTPWYAQPDANYGAATIEVPLDYGGPAYCSLTCQALATNTNVWTGKPSAETHSYSDLGGYEEY